MPESSTSSTTSSATPVPDHFPRAFQWILDTEGPYDNDPMDAGGETVYGISQRFLNTEYPGLQAKDLTLTDVQQIYREYFWAPCMRDAAAHGYSARLAIALFDTAVNQGLSAMSLLYMVARQYGRQDERKVIEHLLRARLARYSRLVQKKPTQIKFLRGWMNRVLNLWDYLDRYDADQDKTIGV